MVEKKRGGGGDGGEGEGEGDRELDENSAPALLSSSPLSSPSSFPPLLQFYPLIYLLYLPKKDKEKEVKGRRNRYRNTSPSI